MVKFSICNELFENWSLERTLECIATLGYNGVEIAPFTIAESVRRIGHPIRRRIAKLAIDRGLEVAGIHWIMLGPKPLHLTSKDAEVRLRTRSYLKDLVEFCGDIGGKVVVFGSPDQRRIPMEAGFKEAWNWAVEAFRECAEHASKHDVKICIEPLRKQATNFINTVDEALMLISDVAHPNFRLTLDAYALAGEEKPMDSLILDGRNYLEHFHANDNNKRGPGFGNLDYEKVANALKRIEFKGFVSVEIFTREPNPEEAARLSIRNLKSFFSESQTDVSM